MPAEPRIVTLNVDCPSWEMQARAGVPATPLAHIEDHAWETARRLQLARPAADVVCLTGVFHEVARDGFIEALTGAFAHQVQLADGSQVAWRAGPGTVDRDVQSWTIPVRVLRAVFGIGARPAPRTLESSGLMVFSRLPFATREVAWPELGLDRIPAAHFVPFAGPGRDGTAHGCLYAGLRDEGSNVHLLVTHSEARSEIGLTPVARRSQLALVCDVLISQLGRPPWDEPVIMCGELDDRVQPADARRLWHDVCRAGTSFSSAVTDGHR